MANVPTSELKLGAMSHKDKNHLKEVIMTHQMLTEWVKQIGSYLSVLCLSKKVLLLTMDDA
jgi:hypothetical protein